MATYNCPTAPKNKVVTDEAEQAIRAGICNCNHLTPASEAELDNLIVPGTSVVPTREEVIARNSPGYMLEPPPEPDWTRKEPTNANLKEIVREEAADVVNQ